MIDCIRLLRSNNNGSNHAATSCQSETSSFFQTLFFLPPSLPPSILMTLATATAHHRHWTLPLTHRTTTCLSTNWSTIIWTILHFKAALVCTVIIIISFVYTFFHRRYRTQFCLQVTNLMDARWIVGHETQVGWRGNSVNTEPSGAEHKHDQTLTWQALILI